MVQRKGRHRSSYHRARFTRLDRAMPVFAVDLEDDVTAWLITNRRATEARRFTVHVFDLDETDFEILGCGGSTPRDLWKVCLPSSPNIFLLLWAPKRSSSSPVLKRAVPFRLAEQHLEAAVCAGFLCRTSAAVPHPPSIQSRAGLWLGVAPNAFSVLCVILTLRMSQFDYIFWFSEFGSCDQIICSRA